MMPLLNDIVPGEKRLFGKDDVSAYYNFSVFVPELPKLEQELLGFYYVKRMNQRDIAKIIGVTQGAVSSRITRAKKRLAYLKELREINFDEFFKDLEEVAQPMDLEIVKSIIKTSCQSETARVINEKFNLIELNRMTQVKVRYRFERVMKKLMALGQYSAKFKDHYAVLRKIKSNFYMLYEVRLPHFDRNK